MTKNVLPADKAEIKTVGKAGNWRMITFILVMTCLLALTALGFWYLRVRGSQPQVSAESVLLAQKMEARVVSTSDGATKVPYRLFVPEGLTEGTAYPLVVWLHGAGGRGDDNMMQLDEGVAVFVSSEVQQIQKSFVLAPQCPTEHEWVEDGGTSAPPYKNYRLADVPETIWLQLVLRVISDLKQKYPVDDRRIYVAGFSMGATGVWDLIIRHSDLFAGAVTLSGRTDPSMAREIVGIPVWAFHGKNDELAPVENTRAMAAALARLGGRMRVTEPATGHDVVGTALSDLSVFEWLFENRK